MIRRLKQKFAGLSLRQLIIHYTAIFDTLIGVSLLTLPFTPAMEVVGWPVASIVGATPYWGIGFVMAGAAAAIGNHFNYKPMGRLALSISSGLAAGRGVAFIVAALLLWPEFAAILVSGGLIWFKHALLIWSAVRKGDSSQYEEL